ncbi:hypothetical protein FBU30_005823 [Linnemannia zychae]|nr:hypothetical protein FBU30_005823 [Linnemannia zychae]
MILLKELFSSLSASEDTNPYDLRLKTVTNLETIFVKFVPLLRLNLVVTADIVCAVVMYNDPENAAFWQSMINMMLRILTDSESTPLLTSLPGFMAEFRDLSEAMSISGLAVALNTLLATPASFMAKNSSLSMDISQ